METVVITGAGSGIGLELTKLFLANGSKILAVSLLQSELEALQVSLDPEEKQIMTLQMDLSELNAADDLFIYCQQKNLYIDVLINNAGFACFGEVIDGSWERMSKMLDLNIRTLTRLSMLFGKLMKERGHGDIVNIGSTAGMLPAKRFAAYGASKAYVNNFTYALRAELKPFGVNVTCVTPAPVATNFAKAAAIDTYQGKSDLKNRFKTGDVATPDRIAKESYLGMRGKKAQVLTGKNVWLFALLARLVPPRKIPDLLGDV